MKMQGLLRQLGLLIGTLALCLGVAAPTLVFASPPAAAAPAAAADENDPERTPGNEEFNPFTWSAHWTGVNDLRDYPWKYGLESGVITQELYNSFTDKEKEVYNDVWTGESHALMTQGVVHTIDRELQDFLLENEEDDTSIGDWNQEYADRWARYFGAEDYDSLPPDLKGLQQRVAMIMTDRKNPWMPDEEWREYQGWDPNCDEGSDSDQCREQDDEKEREQRENEEEDPHDRNEDGKVDEHEERQNNPDVPEECRHLIGANGAMCDAMVDGGKRIVEVVSCSIDAFDCILGTFANSASSMTGWILSTANEATMPTIDTDWFVESYTASFGIGIILFGFVLLWQFLKLSWRRITPAEMNESLMLWTPAFFAGCLFGPPLTLFFIEGAGTLSDGVIEWVGASDQEQMEETYTAFMEGAGMGEMIGGTIVAIITFLLLIIAGFAVFATLILQNVTVQLGGILLPICLAWIVDKVARGGSLKVPFAILAMLLSRPLLFFLMGVGMLMMQSEMFTSDDAALNNTAGLATAVAVFGLAAFSPMALAFIAPTIPKGGGAAKSGVGGGGILKTGGAAIGGGLGGFSGGRLASMSRGGSSRAASSPSSSGSVPPGQAQGKSDGGGGGGGGGRGGTPPAGSAGQAARSKQAANADGGQGRPPAGKDGGPVQAEKPAAANQSRRVPAPSSRGSRLASRVGPGTRTAARVAGKGAKTAGAVAAGGMIAGSRAGSRAGNQAMSALENQSDRMGRGDEDW